MSDSSALCSLYPPYLKGQQGSGSLSGDDLVFVAVIKTGDMYGKSLKTLCHNNCVKSFAFPHLDNISR